MQVLMYSVHLELNWKAE